MIETDPTVIRSREHLREIGEQMKASAHADDPRIPTPRRTSRPHGSVAWKATPKKKSTNSKPTRAAGPSSSITCSSRSS